MAIDDGALAISYLQLVPTMKGATNQINKELAGMDASFNKTASKAGTAFSTAFSVGSKAAVGSIATVTAAIGALTAKGGFDRALKIENATAKLGALRHDTASIETIMDSALASVKGTAYGLGDAASIAANAVAAGIEPGEKLTKYLKMTGDAAAIAGVELSEMGFIVNQVQTGQLAYTDSLNMLADRGLPIYQWIADAAGVAAGEVKDMASKGQISSELFFEAIEKNVGGAAAFMGTTASGAWKNTLAALGRLGEQSATPMLEAWKIVAPAVIGLIDNIATTMKPISELLGDKLLGRAELLASAITSISSGVEGFQFSSLQAFASAMDGLAPVLGAAFVPLLQALPFIGEKLAFLTPAVGGFIGLFVGIFQNSEALRESVSGLFSTIGGALTETAPLFSTVLTMLGDVMGAIGDTLAPVVTIFGQIFADLITQIMPTISVLSRVIGQGLIDVFAALTPVLTTFGRLFGDIFTGLVETVVPIISELVIAVLPPLVSVFEQIMPVVQQLAATLGIVLLDAITTLAPILADMATAILPIFGQMIELLLPPLLEIVDKIFPILTDLMPTIAELFSSIAQVLMDSLAVVLPVIIEYLDLLISAYGDIFAEVLSQAVDIISAVLPILMELIQAVLPVLVDLLGQVIPILSEWVEAVWPAVVSILETVVPILLELVEMVLPILLSLFDAVAPILSTVVEVFGILLEALLPVIATLVESLMPVIESLLPLFESVFSIITPLVEWLGAAFEFLAPIITTVIEIVVDVLAGFATWLIENIAPIIQMFIDNMASSFGWVGDVISNVWSAVQTAVQAVTDWFNTSLLPFVKDLVKNIGLAFEGMRDVISNAWNAIKEAAAIPVNFVINTVYNDGIRAAVNAITSAVGLDDLQLPYAEPVKFASGGIMPGYTPGRDIHQFWSPTAGGLELSGGEAILRPEVTRALGAETIHAWNASRGRGIASVGDIGYVQAFAEGGIWEAITGGAGQLWDVVTTGASFVMDVLRDPIEAMKELVSVPAKALVDTIGGGFFGEAIGQIPMMLIDSVTSLFKTEADKIGGDGLVAAARGAIGTPYIWGGSAIPPGLDCSGLVYWAYQQIGKDIPRLTAAGYQAVAEAVSQPKIGDVALYGNPASHIGIVSGPGMMVHAPQPGSNVSEVPIYGSPDYGRLLYDDGGILQPGYQAVANKTGKPEMVLKNNQWEIMEKLADNAARPLQVYDTDDVLIGTMTVKAREERQRAAKMGG